MTYYYTNSTEIIWTNFDCGYVEADSLEEAYELAKKELTKELNACNEVLKESGYSINMNFNDLEVRLDTNQNHDENILHHRKVFCPYK